ncbi:MAG TPA: FHA domain-containing protein [Candidatus Baltobacteraceae bacterium]|jgi:pSer/pThr/pTyr-binding forkhead associated (FHA) protein|nr:FHA domain-containing protein [Candidatus Baltobacteraceae bacterium]
MMPIAAVANFETAMRLGSLEITAALVAVALLAARPRFRAAAELGILTPMQVGLDVYERGAQRSLEARAPLEIGRSRGSGIALHDSEVSRRHARLAAHDGTLFVEDLESKNGTFLNGRRVTESIEVREGDAIDVGTTRLIVKSLRAE